MRAIFYLLFSFSVIGVDAIVLGMYVMLWGKAEDVSKAAPSVNPQLDLENTLDAPLVMHEMSPSN
jgi:hypothetical protein